MTPADDLNALLAAAASGDIFQLADGTYMLSEPLAITTGVTLRANHTGKAVLDGQHKARAILYISGTGGKEVAVAGLNITGASGGGGVYINGATATFDHCSIYGNSADVVGGGFASFNGTVTFTSCDLHDNEAGGAGGGGRVFQGTVQFNHCNIHSNAAKYGAGVFINDAAASFHSCNVHHNTATAAGGGLDKYTSKGTITLDQATGVHDNLPARNDCAGFADPACGRLPTPPLW